MSATKNIDEYIARLPDWSKAICIQLRDIIHTADPDITEEWKWGQPAFAHGSLVCIVWAFTHHVDRHKLFNFGTNNKQSRTIKFTKDSSIPTKQLIDYVKQAVANAKEGKHVHIPQVKNKTVILPAWLTKLLSEEGLLERYQAQINTYRKGYLQWIESAKKEETKKKRIETMLTELHENRVYMGSPRCANKFSC
jgi:hypothetical protein